MKPTPQMYRLPPNHKMTLTPTPQAELQKNPPSRQTAVAGPPADGGTSNTLYFRKRDKQNEKSKVLEINNKTQHPNPKVEKNYEVDSKN